MADIPPITGVFSSGGVVDAETLYKESLYSPTDSPNNLSSITFEILNGGLTSDNFVGTGNSLKAHQIEMGAMAQGYYFGFNRTDFIYGEVFGSSTETASGILRSNDRIIHSSLSCNVFIPWDTKAIMYGYQAMFAQDSTYYKDYNDGSTTANRIEFYDLEMQIGNNLDPVASSTSATNPSLQMHQTLPHNRLATDVGGTVTYSSDEYSPIADEGSFRYVSKTGMISSTVSKGYLQVIVTVGACIINNDPRKSKIKTPSGSIWIMALR